MPSFRAGDLVASEIRKIKHTFMRAQAVLTVSEVKVIWRPRGPEAHGVDGVIHIPRHRGVIWQGQDHLWD